MNDPNEIMFAVAYVAGFIYLFLFFGITLGFIIWGLHTLFRALTKIGRKL